MIAGATAAAIQELPQYLIQGLMSGTYSAKGGVIMDAAGKVLGHVATSAAEGGLAPLSVVGGIGSNIQLYRLSGEVQKVLSYSMAGTFLAGLGVAVSVGGFLYLSRQMVQLNKKLIDLTDETKDIKNILLSDFHARLRGAIDDYKLLTTVSKPDLRQQILLRSQRSFGDLAHFFKARMQNSSKLVEVVAAEGYFVLAALGHTTCTSDLGMWDESHSALATHHTDWQLIARQQAGSLLGLEDPTRLLHRQYVDELPTDTLIQIMDFVHDRERGVEWLDDLRRDLSDRTMILAGRRVDARSVEYVKSLPARNDVLNGYSAHFGYLADQKLSATEFATTISGYLEQSQVEA